LNKTISCSSLTVMIPSMAELTMPSSRCMVSSALRDGSSLERLAIIAPQADAVTTFNNLPKNNPRKYIDPAARRSSCD